MSVVTAEGDTVAGRYRIAGRLGRGGMAEVWRADDQVLRRQVALKLFHVTGDADDARRAAAEMHTLAGLSHPNLVTVFDAGTDGDRTFLVMELVAGPTLAQRIAAPGGLATGEVAAIGSDLAAGLAYIHRRGVVHRDVKPANVLLPAVDHADAPAAKLVDFGIAQSAGQERLTQTGMTIGTARYLAPEQVTGRPVGPTTDVYALGLVLLEALGCPPAWSGTPVEIAMARLTTAPVVPASLGPVWAPLLAAMTARDPGERPTATQVRATLGSAPVPPALAPGETVDATRALRPAATALLTAAPPGGREVSGRRRGLLRATVGLVAAGAAVTGIVLATAGHDPVAPARTGSTAPAAASDPAPATPGTDTAPSATTVAQTSTPTTTPPTPTPTTPAMTPGNPGAPGGPDRTPPGQTRSKGKPPKTKG